MGKKIYLDGIRHDSIKSAVEAASARMGRTVSYAVLRAAADKGIALWGLLFVSWKPPKQKPMAMPRRDWIRAPLLRYPPCCSPLETWNDWRRHV